MSPPPPPTPTAACKTDTFGSNQMMGIINTARSSSSRTVDVFPGGPIQEMNCSPSQTHCLCSEPREMCGWAVSWGPEAMRAPGCWRTQEPECSPIPTPTPSLAPTSVVWHSILLTLSHLSITHIFIEVALQTAGSLLCLFLRLV